MHQLLQFVLLSVTSLLFAAAFLLGLLRMRRLARAQGAATGLPHESSMGAPARAAVITATIIGAALLVWRAIDKDSFALPVSDPFDAFLLFGLLLSLTVIYFRWTRNLRALSFFLLPMIVILLLIGLTLAVIHQQPGAAQDYHNAWTMLHVITIIAATICFALACVAAVVYLLADRQLRRKGLDSSHRWIGLPSLASIEKLNRWLIFGGFPLLSIATVAGILRVAQAHAGAADPQSSAGTGGGHTKIVFGFLSWLVYAVLLHVPFNPRFRGRRAAWLAIVGFILFIGAFVAANWR